jgi:hypothetical protein
MYSTYWTCSSLFRADGTCGVRHENRTEAQAHVDELDQADRRSRGLSAGSILYTGRQPILQAEN